MLSTNFVDGAPVWVDLGVPDVARAAGFYGSVFGWETDDQPMGEFTRMAEAKPDAR